MDEQVDSKLKTTFESLANDPLSIYTIRRTLGEIVPMAEQLDLFSNKPPDTSKAQTEELKASFTEIPYIALERLGKVFQEGHAKYGRHNWRQGVNDSKYQVERANHAISHLYQYVHMLEYNDDCIDESSLEDHLAKVMWFCATQMELERLEDGC